MVERKVQVVIGGRMQRIDQHSGSVPSARTLDEWRIAAQAFGFTYQAAPLNPTTCDTWMHHSLVVSCRMFKK